MLIWSKTLTSRCETNVAFQREIPLAPGMYLWGVWTRPYLVSPLRQRKENGTVGGEEQVLGLEPCSKAFHDRLLSSQGPHRGARCPPKAHTGAPAPAHCSMATILAVSPAVGGDRTSLPPPLRAARACLLPPRWLNGGRGGPYMARAPRS